MFWILPRSLRYLFLKKFWCRCTVLRLHPHLAQNILNWTMRSSASSKISYGLPPSIFHPKKLFKLFYFISTTVSTLASPLPAFSLGWTTTTENYATAPPRRHFTWLLYRLSPWCYYLCNFIQSGTKFFCSNSQYCLNFPLLCLLFRSLFIFMEPKLDTTTICCIRGYFHNFPQNLYPPLPWPICILDFSG